ncbi:MAG: hypothetical protein Q9M36_14775 [Sulfurovum sp.]|nr:hypothetical protein [Sulfurovum sp.]
MLEKVLERDTKYFIFDSLKNVSDESCLCEDYQLIDFDETKKIIIKEFTLSTLASCDGLYFNNSINFLEFKGFKKIKSKLSPKENLEQKEEKFIQKLESSLIDKIESSIWILDLILKQKSLNLTQNDKINYRKIDKNYYIVTDIDLTKPSKDTFLARLNGLAEIPSSLYNNLITNVKIIIDNIELNVKINKPKLIDCNELKKYLEEKT